MAAQAAKTQYIDAANGVRFAYRTLGTSSDVPLVLHGHFRSNMDYWVSTKESIQTNYPLVKLMLKAHLLMVLCVGSSPTECSRSTATSDNIRPSRRGEKQRHSCNNIPRVG
jgi:hypothetical protein